MPLAPPLPVRAEVDLQAERQPSEASRVRGRFHRLRLAEAPPRPDSIAPLPLRFAALGIPSLPARGERWRKWLGPALHHRRATAVDIDRRARDVGGLVGGKEAGD